MSQLTEPKALDKIDEHSGYAIAGVVKKFFTRLLTPIVPYALYSHLLSMLSTGVRGEDEVGFVRDFLNELPVLNRKVILSLLSFLREHLVSRQQLNKMNNYNLSVCFCPCIFRAETPSLEDLLNSGKFAGIIHVMFNRYD